MLWPTAPARRFPYGSLALLCGLVTSPLVFSTFRAAGSDPNAAWGCGPTGYGSGGGYGSERRYGSELSSRPWCNTTLGHDARAASLTRALSFREKASLLSNHADAVPRLGIPKYNWWSEGLHGLARVRAATSFPQVIGLASTFNASLFEHVGRAIGLEARGINNRLDGELYHGLTLWSPNVNLFRDPRWGRGQETPGEDPHLASAYAANFVRGMQGDEAGTGYLLASATLKHLTSYSMEGAGDSRFGFAAVVSAQDVADTFLPPFREGVEEGRATGLMCSYSAETYGRGSLGDGSASQHRAIPACANEYVLTDLARGQWGFEGYVTTDCGATAALGDRGPSHHYAHTTNATLFALLQAGVDTSCDNSVPVLGDVAAMVGAHEQARREGGEAGAAQLEGLVDRALRRLVHVQMRLGLYDPPHTNPYASLGSGAVDTPLHQQITREAAEQAVVLLKNQPAVTNASAASAASATGTATADAAGVLPLPRRTRRVAVLGPLADDGMNMLGNYYGLPPRLVSPLEGIRGHAPVVAHDDGSNVDRAVALAAQDTLDAVIVVCGLRSAAGVRRSRWESGGLEGMHEAEGVDRTSLLLPSAQAELVRRVSVAAAAGGGAPVVLVLISGGSLDVSEFQRASSGVHAILWCGYPGQAGGTAIGDVLWGRANPSGRLATTWHTEDFVHAVPIERMAMRPIPRLHPGRSHRFYLYEPLYRFGFGLSYSHVHSSVLAANGTATLPPAASGWEASRKLRRDAVLNVVVSVAHRGGPPVSHVVLLFASPPPGVAGIGGAPRQSLVAFEKVALAAGEVRLVSLNVSALALSFASNDTKGSRMLPPGEWEIWVDTHGREQREARASVWLGPAPRPRGGGRPPSRLELR